MAVDIEPEEVQTPDAVGEDTTSAEPETKPEETVVPEPETEPEKDETLEFLKAEFGIDTEKYTNGYEAMKSLVEASRMVGRRDDDAQVGKRLRETFAGREDQIAAILSGELPTAPKADDENGKPVTYEQYQAWSDLVDAKRASPEILRKYRAAQERMARGMVEQFLGNKPEKKAITAEDVARQLAQNEQQAVLSRWDAKNAADLYVEGDESKGLSPLGKRFSEVYSNHPGLAPGHSVERATAALELAKAQMPRVPTPRVPAKSVRKPAVAPSPAGSKTMEDLLDKWLKLDPEHAIARATEEKNGLPRGALQPREEED